MNTVETIQLGGVPAPAPDSSGFVFFCAALLMLGGMGLLVAGVYMLCGLAWAILVSAPLPIAVSLILFRGLKRGS